VTQSVTLGSNKYCIIWVHQLSLPVVCPGNCLQAIVGALVGFVRVLAQLWVQELPAHWLATQSFDETNDSEVVRCTGILPAHFQPRQYIW
jgi:hypothetical protein